MMVEKDCASVFERDVCLFVYYCLCAFDLVTEFCKTLFLTTSCGDKVHVYRVLDRDGELEALLLIESEE